MAEANVQGIAGEQLRLLVLKIERLNQEKAELQETISETFKEAKGQGFDVKALREIIRKRKMKPNERQEQENLLDTYMLALGMV